MGSFTNVLRRLIQPIAGDSEAQERRAADVARAIGEAQKAHELAEEQRTRVLAQLRARRGGSPHGAVRV